MSLGAAQLLPDGDAWEQQPGEGPKAFHAFCHYRDLPPAERSLDKAYREHYTRCLGHKPGKRRVKFTNRWAVWCSTEWGWVERVRAWDALQDRIAREKISKEQTDARVRHARMAQATLQALTVPTRAVLEVLQDPAVLAKLVAEGRETPHRLMKLVDLVTFAGRTMPGLVDVERLALGLSTDLVEVEDKREEMLGNRIAQDAGAVELAIQLLDRIAGSPKEPEET